VPLIAGVNELNLKLEDLATTTTFAQLSSGSFTKRFFDKLIAWFGEVGNGIGEVFARTFRASEGICIGGTCINEAQLIEILGEQGDGGDAASGGGAAASGIWSGGPANAATGTSSASSTASVASTTLPI